MAITLENEFVVAGSLESTWRLLLSVTGRPAQFGRGIMEDVAARMLEVFAKCLSQQLAESPQPPPAVPAASPPLDLTSAVRGVVAGRVVRALGLAALTGVRLRTARHLRRRR